MCVWWTILPLNVTQARASSILLQSHFANECMRGGIKVESTGEHRYAIILKQKSFHLLGQPYDSHPMTHL